MTARRSAVTIIASALVLLAALTLLWSAATTSTAQLRASTSGSGFFAAGTVELDQPETTVALLFDADGLYPGQTVSSCVNVAYEGSVPADIRLHASWSGGTGLEEYVELRVTRTSRSTCEVDGTTNQDATNQDATDQDAETSGDGQATDAGVEVFAGLLGDLWRAHPDYRSGLVLLEGAERGDRLVLDAEIEMVGGDEAQGLTTEFAVIIEARP